MIKITFDRLFIKYNSILKRIYINSYNFLRRFVTFDLTLETFADFDPFWGLIPKKYLWRVPKVQEKAISFPSKLIW